VQFDVVKLPSAEKMLQIIGNYDGIIPVPARLLQRLS